MSNPPPYASSISWPVNGLGGHTLALQHPADITVWCLPIGNAQIYGLGKQETQQTSHWEIPRAPMNLLSHSFTSVKWDQSGRNCCLSSHEISAPSSSTIASTSTAASCIFPRRFASKVFMATPARTAQMVKYAFSNTTTRGQATNEYSIARL